MQHREHFIRFPDSVAGYTEALILLRSEGSLPEKTEISYRPLSKPSIHCLEAY